MNNEIARMRFKSGRRPGENGAVVITDDGFLHLEPSDEFVAEIARLEHKAVERSRRVGMTGALALIGLGAFVAAYAWLAGRLGGEMRTNLCRPRPLEDVEVKAGADGRVRVVLPGDAAGRLRLEWERGEVSDEERDRLIAVYNRFREVPRPTGE